MHTTSQVKAAPAAQPSIAKPAAQPLMASAVETVEAPSRAEQMARAHLGHHFGAISVLPPDPPSIQPKRMVESAPGLSAFRPLSQGRANPAPVIPAGWAMPQVQTKLTVGEPNDPYEQEADRVADQVLRMAEPRVQAKCACGGEAGAEGECAACKAQRLGIQRQAQAETAQREEVVQAQSDSAPSEAAPDLEQRLNGSRGSGHALPSDTRGAMEAAFGADFGGVRVHTGNEAVQMNRELSAHAFTHGSDIYFNAGKYEPGSVEGKGLLAHELTHVGQQGHSIVNTIQRRTIRNNFVTTAFETGPLWDVNLTITSAPSRDTDSLEEFSSACHEGIRGAADALGHNPQSSRRQMRVSMRYRRIRPDSTNFSDISQEAYRLALLSVLGRIPQPAPAPSAPSLPPVTNPSPPPLNVVSCTSFPITIGTRGGCGTGDDSIAGDFPPLTSVPGSLSMSARVQDLSPDLALRSAPQGVLLGLAGSDGYSAFSDFYNSTTSRRTFSSGSDVATRAQSHSAFTAAKSTVESLLVSRLTAQAAGNTIDCSAITLAPLPPINFSGSSDMKLWTLIGGTQGLSVELTNIEILPLTRAFTADVIFRICDDFGVDVSDLSRSGVSGEILNNLLLPFWILQHRRTGHTPLVLNIEINEHFAGNF